MCIIVIPPDLLSMEERRTVGFSSPYLEKGIEGDSGVDP